MRKIYFTLLILLIFYIGYTFNKEEVVKTEIEKIIDEKLFPYEGHFLAKQFPFKETGIEAREVAFEEVLRSVKMGLRSEGTWITQGPGNIGARINTIAVSPTNDDIIFVGFSAGGLWKTLNGGQTWTPTFDNQTSNSIGKIVFHPEEPNTLFVGTGDPNIGGYYFIGDGLYKSTDLGETWQNFGLKETRVISSIGFSPVNSDIMYVGTMGAPYERNLDRGLYKTTNGGQTWSNVLSIDDQTGITGIVVDKNDPNTIYASAWTRIRTYGESITNSDKAGVYRSKNGGTSWTKLSNGLPGGETSRVGIAGSSTNSKVLYALVVSSANQNPEGLYKTINGGDQWDKIKTNNDDFDNSLGGFGWYFSKIFVDPRNDKRVYVLGVDLWKVEQKDTVVVELATPYWSSYEVHADKHDMQYANGNFYLATDGGLYKQDINNSNPQWEDIENIPTTQFYRVAYNPHNPDYYVGGAQDNGTSGGNQNNIAEWDRIRGGDGFQPAFYKNNPDIWFAETQNGRISFSENAGFNWRDANSGIEGSRHWDMQYIISPHDDNVMYTATQQVYKSVNGVPPNWTSTSDTIVDYTVDAIIHQATAIDQSPVDKNILYVGTSDGLVWGSSDEAITWQKKTNGLPNRYVSSIKASPNKESNVYVTYTGYRDGDYTPKVYKSDDYGNSWTSIVGNLPNIAINDIYIYPYRSEDEVLFVAGDAGVYFTKDNGQTWERMGENLPLVPVFDMDLNVFKNELIAATFGRSIMTFNLDQIGITQEISNVIDQNKFTWNVYPNPTNSQITIEGLSPSSLIKVIDFNGKLVLEQKVMQSTETINLENLPNGSYLIKSDKGNKLIVKQ